jgi:hypothetical protein
MKRSFYAKVFLLLFAFLLIATGRGWSQLDQGSITGVVQDSTGAVIPNANLQLTDTATGLQLKAKSDGSGVFSFSPIKIGTYTVVATATGFESVKQENITVNIQSRVNVPIVMAAGGLAQSITVNSTPPALQTQDASVAQVMTAATIDHTPLNGRNYVYIAQLANGTAPAQGSRGGGSGDFEANGQRAEENNFILDGVDNNVNVVDFANGASYNVQPPPDALAEFSVQTSDYSAEFGHSAGAVVNASIKSGSNAFHGDLWEYFRNNIRRARLRCADDPQVPREPVRRDAWRPDPPQQTLLLRRCAGQPHHLWRNKHTDRADCAHAHWRLLGIAEYRPDRRYQSGPTLSTQLRRRHEALLQWRK